MKRLFGIGTLAMVLLFTTLSSCNEVTGDSGQFKVRMTDAPGDYAALNLTVTRVDAFLENEGWVNLSSETQNVNVLSLTNGNEVVLANNTEVKTGLYTRLKITFGVNGTIELQGGGGSANISWVGGIHEVELAIHEQVSAQASASVLVDFNVAQSIVESAGEYIIEPAVEVVSDMSTGIQGTISGTLYAAIILTNGGNTYSTYINQSGEFIIRGVEPGTYTLTVFEPGMLQGNSYHNIIIVQGQIYQMTEIHL